MSIKSSLRNQMRQLMDSYSESSIQDWSLQLTQNIVSWLIQERIPSGSIIGVFAPLPGEPLIAYSKFLGLSLAFPLINSNGLMAFHLCDQRDLIPQKVGSIGLHSPPPGRPLVTPCLLLIPGLAFNRAGYRLGRGKGFYDKYLVNNKVKTVGVCFTDQLIEDDFSSDHDHPVDWIITEKSSLAVKQV